MAVWIHMSLKNWLQVSGWDFNKRRFNLKSGCLWISIHYSVNRKNVADVVHDEEQSQPSPGLRFKLPNANHMLQKRICRSSSSSWSTSLHLVKKKIGIGVHVAIFAVWMQLPRLTYGLKNAALLFQRFEHRVLKRLHFCFIYESTILSNWPFTNNVWTIGKALVINFNKFVFASVFLDIWYSNIAWKKLMWLLLRRAEYCDGFAQISWYDQFLPTVHTKC